MKNVLKIEKNEELNYEFGKQRGCEKRIVPKKKKDQEFIMNSLKATPRTKMARK